MILHAVVKHSPAPSSPPNRGVSPETAPAVAEEEIRSVLDKWADAIRKKDVDGVVTQFSADSVRFYLAPPLQAMVPLQENLESWFDSFPCEIGCEIRDLKIFVSNEVAYAHSFNRIVGTKTTGEKVDLWLRETFGLRKIDGRWLVTHAHDRFRFTWTAALEPPSIYSPTLEPPSADSSRQFA
jgi:PhnB protein